MSKRRDTNLKKETECYSEYAKTRPVLIQSIKQQVRKESLERKQLYEELYRNFRKHLN